MTALDWPVISIVIMITGVLIGFFVIWRMLKDRRSGFPAGDERTRRITGKASSYAFLINQYFTITLLIANIISRELYGSFLFSSEAGYVLVATLLVSSLSLIGLRWYFGRQGDF